jgi:hypothetical protein
LTGKYGYKHDKVGTYTTKFNLLEEKQIAQLTKVNEGKPHIGSGGRIDKKYFILFHFISFYFICFILF